MKKGIFKVVVLCMAGLLLSGLVASCATPAPEEEVQSGITVTDQLGRTVTLEKAAEKIVSLSPSNTEILFALGLGDNVVGVTKYCDYPAEAQEKPNVGGFSTPNLEEIVALAPDIVIASQRHEDEIIPQLEERGLTVIGLNPKTFDLILDSITLVGEVSGKSQEASRLVSDMETRIEAITDKVSSLSDTEKPDVFYLTWHDPLKTSGAKSLHDELIRKAGGKNLFGDVEGTQTVDLETLIDRNPQVIIAGIGMGTGEDKTLQYLLGEERLKDIEAAKNDNITGIDLDLSGRGGPRIVDGLEKFARSIHPELFGQP
ncbi:ABC transporter substrate-binding protein [Chloroflexota bacterium]